MAIHSWTYTERFYIMPDTSSSVFTDAVLKITWKCLFVSFVK